MKLNIRAIKFINSLAPNFFLIMIFKSIFTAFSPYINLYMSAEITNELIGNRDVNKLIILVSVTIIMNLISSAMNGLFDKLYSDANTLFTENERIYFTNATLNMAYSDIENPNVHQLRREIANASMIDSHGSGRIIQMSSSLIDNVIELIMASIIFSQLFVLLIKHGITIVHVIFVAAIIILIVVNTLNKFYIQKIKSSKSMDFTTLNSYGQRINSGLYSYNMGKDIRLYRIDKIILKIKKEYQELSKKYYNDIQVFEFFRGVPESFINKTLQCVIYTFVCTLVISGITGIGDVIKYAGTLQRFVTSINSLIYSLGEIKYNTPFIDNYFKFLDIPSESIESGNKYIDNNNYNIEFKNVSFRYPKSNTYALRNVSVNIKSGEHLAVVGMNGSGKTTFIKLLCRLYDPSEGEILLNGINIKEYDYIEYMNVFSILFQDFKIFSFSLGENIALDDTYNLQLIERTLEKVGFNERYMKFEKGLDTYLYKDFEEDGIEISGGEAQKIALARALYKNSPMIILDEPTSALDPIAEYEIYSKFNEITYDKTAVFISHRLSSCRFCDNILVFHDGHVVQHGSHEKLVTDGNGKYYELWNAQAQYYTENS
jgi:ABC-type bacteriocin/lantibiotic exporters, contain an N-terminal double-glycine peptidase domain